MAVREGWYYWGPEGKSIGPVSGADVLAALDCGDLTDRDQVFNEYFGEDWQQQGVPAHSLRKLQFEFDPPVSDFLADRKDQPLTVLAGPNNVGKTFLLKWLCASHGPGAYLLGCNRFYHVNRLRSSNVPSGAQLYNNFNRQFITQDQNTDQNHLNLEQMVIGLPDTGRASLFRLVGEIIGADFEIRRVDPDNEFSERYVVINGEELAVSSAGTRLLIVLLGACFNPSIETLFVDEPELGLSPATQSAVAELLQNQEARQELFPHLKRVFLATHSHLLLDRSDFSNNFTVQRDGTSFRLSRIQSISEFQTLQFGMLGNELESLFLPSAIVVVEGPSDHRFLSTYSSLFDWGRHVTVVRGHGDGGILRKLSSLRDALGDPDRSPYRDRIMCVLDKQHSVPDRRLVALGVPAERRLVWSKNGIEYYYPRDIMRDVFSCSDDALESLDADGEAIEINGIAKTKTELADIVATRMREDSEFPEELAEFDAMVKATCEAG